MASVPAFCDSCGTIFSSGFSVEGTSGVTFSGCKAGPCPRCGGVGHIPDGVYKFVDNTIHLLAGPSRSHSELTKLAFILKEARQKGASREEVSTSIKKELPGLTSIADILPTTKTDLYAFIAIILTIIQMLLNSSNSKEEQIRIEVQQVINQIIDTGGRMEKVESEKSRGAHKRDSMASKAHKNKMGRGAPCICQSGKTYKRCCGKK